MGPDINWEGALHQPIYGPNEPLRGTFCQPPWWYLRNPGEIGKAQQALWLLYFEVAHRESVVLQISEFQNGTV